MKLKRLLCSILCIAMILSTMGFTVFADETTVAKIGDEEFTGLDAALEYAAEKEISEVEIDVVGDITLSTKVKDFKKVTFTGTNREQTVDLNLNTAFDEDVAMEFNDLTVSRLDADWLYHYTYVRGGLSYNNCKMIGLFNVTAQNTDFIKCDFYNDDTFGDGNYSLWLYNCYDGIEVNVIDCTFNVYERAIKIYGDGYKDTMVLNISDTTFESRTEDKTVVEMAYDNSTGVGEMELNITGSTATGFGAPEHIEGNTNAWFNVEGNDTASTVKVDDAVVYSDYNAALTTNSETTNYKTLQDAVAAAQDGDTITLLNDVILGENIVISNDVTIVGEHTITRADDYTKTLFTVDANASLTLGGNLTIDGGNNWTFDADTYDADLQAMESVSDANKYITPEDGAPVATAYMIVTNGIVSLNDVTIQNNYSEGKGIVEAKNGATVTLTGTQITHNANTKGSGLVVNAYGKNTWDSTPQVWVTMNEGTVIDGNHIGGNHGVFKVYSGTVFTMNGGEIKNTTGWNSNGVAVGIYWATFNMNGGEICSNSSVRGPSNGRNAAVYAHSASTMIMTGGTICHNQGRSRGGIDAPYTGQTGNASTVTIEGGYVLDNISIYGNADKDVSGGAALVIKGGEFTQDISEWVDPDFEATYNEETGSYGITDRYVATVNGEKIKQSEFEQAINAVEDGSAVTLLEDITVTETIEVHANVTATLDLNGKTLQTDATVNDATSVHLISNKGNLTVTDSVGSGALISNDCNTAEDGTKTKNGFAISNTEGGTLVLEDVKIVGTNWGYALYVVDANSTVTINDGTVVEGRGVLYLDGGATGTINGGEFAITVATTNNQDNVVYVGGTSELVINGGDFDASQVEGAQRVAIASLGTSKVTINGGTFNSLTGDIQARAGVGSVLVTGGTFKGTKLDERTEDAIAITGGTFNYDPTDYIAEDYEVEESGSYEYPYIVKDKAPSAVEVVLEETDDKNVYDIVLKSTDEYGIYEFVSAELTFDIGESETVGGAEMKYEISGITTDSTVVTVVEQATDNEDQFIIRIPKGSIDTRLSGTEITIGQVKFYGQGTINSFSVTDGEVVATRKGTHLGKYYKKVDGTLILDEDAVIENGGVNAIKRNVQVNVKYNHPFVGGHWTDDKMTVTLKNNFGYVSEPMDISDGTETFDEVPLGRITVTLEAPGFRKYTYTTVVEETADNGTLVLNFWNDVKRDTEEAIEAGKATMTNNFLVGDIVMDYIVDEYDLAAVTSYYGTYGIEDTEANSKKYLKYDLNRDGNIDIMDVHYVLHTYDN